MIKQLSGVYLFTPHLYSTMRKRAKKNRRRKKMRVNKVIATKKA